VTTENQTLFIPENISRLRFSELSVSRKLASVLRRLRVSTFEDLAGVSLREFQRVSDSGTELFLEIGQLIQRARRGDFAAPPFQQVRVKQDFPRFRIVHLPERATNTDYDAQSKLANDRVNSESPQDETIFIPQEARGQFLAAFPVSVRLKHIFEMQHFRLFGDLHGHKFSDFRRYRNCGKNRSMNCAN
jgi:hypothetical protein